MRWEDERYVRIYTRDTGDWLSLSFEAQAVFMMLLRKVDRIGELHLGKRGLSAVPACIGHGGRPIESALQELLADGCLRLSDARDRLFVPNFLEAQEVAKSPTERKREQRERDALRALENSSGSHRVPPGVLDDPEAPSLQPTENIELSRDVTPVTNGHEMSPRAVPCRAVPSRAEPPEPSVPSKTTLSAEPTRGAQEVFEHWRSVMGKGGRTAFDAKRRGKVEARLKDGYGIEDLKAAINGCALTPHNMGLNDKGERYDDLELICRDAAHVDRFRTNATAPPRPRASGKDPRNAPVRAEDIPRELFAFVGDVTNEF